MTQNQGTGRGRKRTKSEGGEGGRTGLFDKTREELEKERKAFNEKMRKKPRKRDTQARLVHTQRRGERRILRHNEEITLLTLSHRGMQRG